MELKESAKYWKDKNGNKWSKSRYTIEEAQAASDSLITCKDCKNCWNCKDCWDCEDCENCKGCEECWGDI